MDENHLYEAEVSPKEVLKIMKTNIYDNFFKNSYFFITSDYLVARSSLFSLIRKISNKMGFKSQTYFLSIYYLDILFSKNKKIDCNIKTLGLACLLLSAKYVENDPCVPNLAHFIKVYNNVVGYKYIMSVTDLFYAEVLTCKMLGYKLNYYTIYDFDSFFFGHGIIKIEQLRELNNENLSHININNFEINATNSIYIRRILEKIYRKSRDYLELIVNNSNLCLKYNSLIISIFIMKKSVEEILFDEAKINKHDLINKEIFLTKTSNCFKEIMKELYLIDYESIEDFNELISDIDLIKLLQEGKKDDVSPVLVDLENNIKFSHDINNDYSKYKTINDYQNTISSYSHIHRYSNNSLNKHKSFLNKSLNRSQILNNINITRNSKKLVKYNNLYSQSSFKVFSRARNNNNLTSNNLDISNLSSSKELKKIEPKKNKYREERITRALTRNSDIKNIKYLQKISSFNYYNKRPNNSNSLITKKNKSISIENDDDIIDIINTMENDSYMNTNESIKTEFPIKLQRYKKLNFEKYKKLSSLQKKPIKDINSFIKNNDYSDNSITQNTVNNIKYFEEENNSKNYKKKEKKEIKPYFRKVIRNTTNNNNINNFSNSNHIKQRLSHNSNTLINYTINNNIGKRNQLESRLSNPLLFNNKEKNVDKRIDSNVNANLHDNNNFFNEINKKDKNKLITNLNTELNQNKINTMREKKVFINKDNNNYSLFNIKKNISSQKIKIEEKDKNINNKEYNDNNNKVNNNEKEDKESSEKNKILPKKNPNEDKIFSRKIELNKEEHSNNKEDKENKYNENKSNRERKFLNRMRRINVAKENNYRNDYKYINEAKVNKTEIFKNNENDEIKNLDNEDNAIKYKRKIKRKESKNELQETSNNNESKPNIISKRKYFLSNKNMNESNYHSKEYLNNNNKENIYENKFNQNYKENNEIKNYNSNREIKYKSIRNKYINKKEKDYNFEKRDDDDERINKNKEEEKEKEKKENEKEKEKITEIMDEEKQEENIIVNNVAKGKRNENNIKKRDVKILTDEVHNSNFSKSFYPTSSIYRLLHRTKTINNGNLQLTKEELNLELPNNYLYNYNKKNRIIKAIRTKDHNESRDKEIIDSNIINKEILLPKEISYNTFTENLNNNRSLINNNKDKIIHSYHHRKLLKNKNNNNSIDFNHNSNKNINGTSNTIVINNNININFNNKIEPIQGAFTRNNELKANISDNNYNNNDFYKKIIINKANNSRHKTIIEKYNIYNNNKIKGNNYYTRGTIECININKNDKNKHNSISSFFNKKPYYKNNL